MKKISFAAIGGLVDALLAARGHSLADADSAPEPEKDDLGFEDRVLLAGTLLGMCAEYQDGHVSARDVIMASYVWSDDEAQMDAVAHTVYKNYCL